MGFSLEEVVPWGRSFDEYGAMFALDEADLKKRILGCGDGPASFNATLSKRGGTVVSADPVYQFATGEIANRIERTSQTVLEQLRRNVDAYVWTRIRSVEELGEVRISAMREFLEDFEAGRDQGRYVIAELPELPFSDRAFDLALCSHFLFLYGGHLDLAFHLQSLRELCRVASEVRVFPIVELDGARSRHLDAVISELAADGYAAEVETVSYEFQRGGNEMLRLRHRGF